MGSKANVLSEYHIFGSVFLVLVDNVAVESRNDPRFRFFNIKELCPYSPFADDFGPMNLAAIYQFCELLTFELGQCHHHLALLCTKDYQSVTNAVFLLGSYLIASLNYDLEATKACFAQVRHLTSSYRDVSPGPQNFDLHIADCWGGLLRAKGLQWADFSPSSTFDLAEYLHYDDPLNADLHVIVPGKLVAFRGPRDLIGADSYEDVRDSKGRFSHRDFASTHYSEMLLQVRAPESISFLHKSGLAIVA